MQRVKSKTERWINSKFGGNCGSMEAVDSNSIGNESLIKEHRLIWNLDDIYLWNEFHHNIEQSFFCSTHPTDLIGNRGYRWRWKRDSEEGDQSMGVTNIGGGLSYGGVWWISNEVTIVVGRQIVTESERESGRENEICFTWDLWFRILLN